MSTQKLTPPASPASTESRGFIQNPETLEDHVHNVRFQLDNVEGYLLAHRDGRIDLFPAHVKAECLAEASDALFAAIHRETRALKGGGQ